MDFEDKTKDAMEYSGLNVRKMLLPNDILYEQVTSFVKEGHTVSFNVKGYSMTPFLINNRDYVKIGPFSEQGLKPGDIILAKTTNQTIVLHRVIALRPDGVILMGDGNFGGTEEVKFGNIAGIAESVVRNGIEISCANKLWISLSYCWRNMGPFRIILLKILRRIYYKELYEKETRTNSATSG